MNYVGSVSILDRGDAPAQAVIDRNARSLAQRVADETREELAKVLTRVDNIYGNFELSQSLLENNKTNLECVQDLLELESLLQDQVKKKKYQQQVTIFIVGFENVCGQKLRLLQQVNEFFVENATLLEEDDMLLQSPDLDLEEMEDAVEETLKQTENLAQKLSNLKKGLDEHMHNLTQIKGSTKAKKTKELEKDLNAAKKQLEQVNNSLRELAKEVKEKSEKIDQLQHDIEKRNVDVMRYKKMAEEAKKMADYDALKAEAAERNEEIRELKLEIERLKAEMGQEKQQKEQDLKVLMADKDKDLERIKQLEFALDDQIVMAEESKQELIRLHEEEMEALKQQHEKIINDLKQQHADEIRTLLEEALNAARLANQGNTAPKDLSTDPGDRSRPVTKEASRLSRQKKKRSNKFRSDLQGQGRGPNHDVIDNNPDVNQTDAGRSRVSFKQSRSRGSSNKLGSKESSEGSILVEEHEVDSHKQPSRGTLKTRSNLEPVQEIQELHDDGFDLKDETSWSGVPHQQIPARFLQYRQLTRKKLEDLEAQIEYTVQKTTRKITTLKAQFQEHKSKWEKEREVLLSHLDQAEKLQTEAEKEADIAISQLEEIINDQEELEKENEEKHAGQENGQREASLTLQEAEDNLNSVLEDQAQFLEEQLLTQTDDAKAELSRKGTKIDSSGTEVAQVSSPRSSVFSPVLHKTQSLVEFPTQPIHSSLRRHLTTTAIETSSSSHAPEAISREPSGLSAPGSDRAPSVSVDPPSPPTSSDHHDDRHQQAASDLSDAASLSSSIKTSKTPDKSLQREETLSRASMCSRASLQERRQLLSTLKASAEERRSKSPSVYSIRSRKSVLSGAELDENGDMPFPKDESKEERESRLSLHDAATSPIYREKSILSDDFRPGIPMHEHPVVQEYIKTYNSIIQFRDNLSQLFMDKDMTSLSHVLSELEPVQFNKEERVQPQVERMNKSTEHMLEEILQIINNILSSERSYPVSSLIGVGSKEQSVSTFPRAGTATSVREDSRSYTAPSSVTSKHSSTRDHLRELQEQYVELQKHFEEERKKHETQLNHNTVVMMEMQDTINNLKRELSTMNNPQQQEQEQQPQSFEGPVMFTRLDSERNAKIMKRAVNEKRLDPAKYELAMEKMEDYNSLPAKRLGHLVNKYVHHVQMKEVEENVRKSNELDEEVFQVLDKMEALQNERAKRWADHMDQMGEERLHLVSELMTTLDNIEQESGIFLIKPMYSYKGNTGPEKYQGKLSRAYRPNQRGISRSGSDYRSSSKYQVRKSTPGQYVGKENVKSPESRDEGGLSGTSTHLLGDYPKPVWNQQLSTLNQDSSRYMPALPGQINTPRILELDINRMLIGQNQVSIRVPQGFVSNDRLANAANTSIRSYVTVNRPSGQPASYKDRPRSHTGISDAPPATPLVHDMMSQKCDSASNLTQRSDGKQVHLPTEATHSPHDSPISRAAFSSTSPLPPIGGDTVNDHDERGSTHQSEGNISSKNVEAPYPPISPPGSSLRQTPGYTAYSPQTPAQA